MKLLDRYFMRQFLNTYFIILSSFSVLFIVIDVIDRLPRLIRSGATFQLAVSYYLLNLPYLFVLTSPITLLLTGLFMMNSLAKYNESIAVRAAGISVKRMVMPILFIGLVISAFMGIFGEYVLPWAETSRDYVYNVKIKNQPPEDEKLRSRIHYIGKQNQLYYIGFFDGYRNQLKVIDISVFDPNSGEITQKISASDATWTAGKWLFRNCDIRTFANHQPKTYQHFQTTYLPMVDVTPIDFVKSAKKPMSMNYFELKSYVNRLQKVGEKYTKQMVDLYMKISYPLANFIILFFCVPVATSNMRSKGRGWIFMVGLLVCFLYLTALRVSQSLGYNAILSPIMAAWLPNVIFLSLGMTFLWKAEI
ncbi:MAG TPA: LptF/LptG family permease [Candidatus Cloacimonadota bacterium]|mgnify:CR=1 FL=1|nr:LptF/LptG family permease [Candidatus Cloacimonadota bacterium]